MAGGECPWPGCQIRALLPQPSGQSCRLPSKWKARALGRPWPWEVGVITKRPGKKLTRARQPCTGRCGGSRGGEAAGPRGPRGSSPINSDSNFHILRDGQMREVKLTLWPGSKINLDLNLTLIQEAKSGPDPNLDLNPNGIQSAGRSQSLPTRRAQETLV